MTRPPSRWATSRKCSARHILVETEDEAKAIAGRPEEGRRLRRDRQGEVEGSRARKERRRSRLLHQGPDGAGIRRGRLQARQGPALRSGQVAVRLARHQGRGQAQPSRRPTSSRSRSQIETYRARARRRPTSSASCAATPRSRRSRREAEPIRLRPPPRRTAKAPAKK